MQVPQGENIGLPEPARVHFVKKLQLIGLQDVDDPYNAEVRADFVTT